MEGNTHRRCRHCGIRHSAPVIFGAPPADAVLDSRISYALIVLTVAAALIALWTVGP